MSDFAFSISLAEVILDNAIKSGFCLSANCKHSIDLSSGNIKDVGFPGIVTPFFSLICPLFKILHKILFPSILMAFNLINPSSMSIEVLILMSL